MVIESQDIVVQEGEECQHINLVLAIEDVFKAFALNELDEFDSKEKDCNEQAGLEAIEHVGWVIVEAEDLQEQWDKEEGNVDESLSEDKDLGSLELLIDHVSDSNVVINGIAISINDGSKLFCQEKIVDWMSSNFLWILIEVFDFALKLVWFPVQGEMINTYVLLYLWWDFFKSVND